MGKPDSVEITELDDAELAGALLHAAQHAAGGGRTWITSGGVRVGLIIPVKDADLIEPPEAMEQIRRAGQVIQAANQAWQRVFGPQGVPVELDTSQAAPGPAWEFPPQT